MKNSILRRVVLWIARSRRGAVEALHGLFAALSLTASFWVRFEFDLEDQNRTLLMAALPLVLGLKLAVFRAWGLRDLSWRDLGFSDLVRLGWANLAASVLAGTAVRLAVGSAFPRSIHVLDFLICLALMTGARAAARVFLERRPGKTTRPGRRIFIYGAGKAGIRLLSEIGANPEIGYSVAGFLDDDAGKHGLRVHGMRVLGSRTRMEELVRRHRVEEVLLALPAAGAPAITSILEACRRARVEIRKIPALTELIENKVWVDQIREVRVEDLLGRPAVRWDAEDLRAALQGRVIFVTGAGGSIGSELCRQIAPFGPSALIGFDNAETPLYQIDQELRERFPSLTFVPEVGSIQNRRRLREVLAAYRPAAIYHAAAYKHVPMMEAHLFEAVENNVFGTCNLVKEAAAAGVESFVLVSSDKAVRPTNVMGATKRLAELACLAQPGSDTRFMAVRFGNVLDSNGSVIPLFRRQIAAGGPVTVTDPEVRRFFMTIPEAAQLVLQAAAMGEGGEIFVLNMGEPVRILDLARKMILLSGLRPEEDIKIEFSGLRPGEKMFEELNAYEEHTVPTPHRQIRIFTGRSLGAESLARHLEHLRRSAEERDAGRVVLILKELIPEYNPSSFLLRRALTESPQRSRLNAAASA